MKTVWIINQYISTPEIGGDGYRHYYMARYMKDTDYSPYLITSSFAHAPFRDTPVKFLYRIFNEGVPTLVLKGNRYKDSGGAGRILNWLAFCLALLWLPFIPKKILPRPDIIVLSSLPLIPVLNVQILKLLYPHVKFVFEIRDIWPLSAVQIGGYASNNPFIRFLEWIERLGYSNADYIVSVIPRADLHIRNVLGHNEFRFKWISNGYDISNAEELPLEPEMAKKLNKPGFKIGYAGTLVLANPLDTLIRVVGKQYVDKIELFILGDGPERKSYELLAQDIPNIHLLGRIPRKYVHSFLKSMDLLYMGKGTKESEVYKFGTSQLKTFDYFYSAKPIIQALCSDENPVRYSGAGFVIPPQEPAALSEVIDRVLAMTPEERTQMGHKGYEYLISNCTYLKITERFLEVLDEL
jgi:glycosyltransferase involved in cell wall biosynthesis